MGVYAVGLVAHVGAGKTSLGEALLYRAGAVGKMGSVDQGTAVLDWEAEEKARKSSTQTGTATLTWRDHRIELLDTPGSLNFIGQTLGAVRVLDGAVMLASAEPGLQSQTDQLWELLEARAVPRLMVINQLDREQADFAARLDGLNAEFGNRLAALQIPWGEREHFRGVIDLVRGEAIDYSHTDKPKAGPIPEELTGALEPYRARLVECAAEGDDALLEKYLETDTLQPEELWRGLVQATRTGQVVPVLCAAASHNVGTDRLLDAIVELLPDFEESRRLRAGRVAVPEDFQSDLEPHEGLGALAFKTKLDHYSGKLTYLRVLSGTLRPGEDVADPVSGATERPAHLYRMMGKEQKEVTELNAGEIGVVPKLARVASGHTLCSPKHKLTYAPIAFPQPLLSYALKLGKGEEDKVSTALHRMMEEDPTLAYEHNVETGDFLVHGMGKIQLDLVLQRLEREYHIKAEFAPPHVPYRETIRGSAKAQGKYKKQTGGRGQYGDCWLELKPNGREETLSFHSTIVGGAIPKGFIPAIEKGIAEAMGKGVMAGYPVIGIDATVYDGSYHDVDSSEMAFKIAGSMAFKKAMEQARPVLLEPILEMEIVCGADHMGDVMGDINGRRGRVLGMESRGGKQLVKAEVPMAEALSYAIDLRAMTHGQGRFTRRFARYQEVPAPVAEKVIAAHQAETGSPQEAR